MNYEVLVVHHGYIKCKVIYPSSPVSCFMSQLTFRELCIIIVEPSNGAGKHYRESAKGLEGRECDALSKWHGRSGQDL